MPSILGRAPAREEPEENPEEVARYWAAVDRIQEEKRTALADKGIPWKEWWFYSASKWYVVLLFLVVDVWALVAWADGGGVYLLPVLAGLAYLEFLLYQYLYYRSPTRNQRRSASVRRTWYRPVEFGRWTPEGERARTGRARVPGAEEGAVGDEGPSPDEFF